MSLVNCECGTQIDSDYDVECFVEDRILCEHCRDIWNVSECTDCGKWRLMHQERDPWGGQHDTSMCKECHDNYDPTPEHGPDAESAAAIKMEHYGLPRADAWRFGR